MGCRFRILLVPNDTRRSPVAHILRALNHEWSALTDSPEARRALMRWSVRNPVLAEARTLDDVLAINRSLDRGPELRRFLAHYAPSDDLAARVLLQVMLGGLCNLSRNVGRDGDALSEIVALAWERIRTYPAHRPGSVSGNILLDVRKWYSQLHRPPAERTKSGQRTRTPDAPSAEDEAVNRSFLAELVAASDRAGVSRSALATVVRSRAMGESMADLADEQQVTLKVLWHRRWRAEARLRELPLAG